MRVFLGIGRRDEHRHLTWLDRRGWLEKVGQLIKLDAAGAEGGTLSLGHGHVVPRTHGGHFPLERYLLLVGFPVLICEILIGRTSQSNPSGAFTALGATNEADLRAAYRASDVLLFPSLYEGFGLPVLEAMASELPVGTSGAGGLAEVAGDAALVVGGREVEPYTVVLKGIAESEEARHTLARRGLEQARRFRWADAARRTAEVYRAMI